KFVKREIRRGNKYDAIIMDPPSYGRGANGEVWNIEKDLYNLVLLCSEILSDNPLFFLINSYTTGLSATVLANILSLTVNKKCDGLISCGEVGLPIKENNLILPCGIYGRWESND
ncbi:MAG TPA: SAM-dependent methyltransferase, partial [Firmicutes bacterium]|nr:SAM-dependent methyltransferase [Bacillota bacterium]